MPFHSAAQQRWAHAAAARGEVPASYVEHGDAAMRRQRERPRKGYDRFGVKVGKARLTAAERAKLPDSAFAIPSRRAYPIHDPAHARNALARVNQAGTSGSPKTIARKVARRFPSIGKSAGFPQIGGAGVGYRLPDEYAQIHKAASDRQYVGTGLAGIGAGAGAVKLGAEMEHRLTVPLVRSKRVFAGQQAAAQATGDPARLASLGTAARRLAVKERVFGRQVKAARRVKAGGLGLAAVGTVAAYRGLRGPRTSPMQPGY